MAAKKALTATERWALPANQTRSRATRERLLTAAEQVFAEKGYDGARLSDIAEEAGCSVGAVYFRFKDKDALFFAIAESFIEEARTGLGALLGDTSSMKPDGVVRLFVTATARSFERHKGLFRAIVERGLDHPHAMKTIMAFREELAAALEKALRGGSEASLPVRVMTQMIYGFMLTGILNKHAPTRFGDRRAVDELTKACVAYLSVARS
ncbi:MAG TPA: TetR/AcrR family transcriptional regulator [Rhizomicrobium sp.]|jgi:AcrR family transcriptional regulator|nr:TetR/AcrR family transcriptional regulator [Rhizomicrobium sp.]